MPQEPRGRRGKGRGWVPGKLPRRSCWSLALQRRGGIRYLRGAGGREFSAFKSQPAMINSTCETAAGPRRADKEKDDRVWRTGLVLLPDSPLRNSFHQDLSSGWVCRSAASRWPSGGKGGSENQRGFDKVYLTFDKLPGEGGRNMDRGWPCREAAKIGNPQGTGLGMPGRKALGAGLPCSPLQAPSLSMMFPNRRLCSGCGGDLNTEDAALAGSSVG